MAEEKFEVFLDKKEEFRFHLKTPDGEIIAVSEGYEKKTGCLNGIESVKVNSSKANIRDLLAGRESLVDRPGIEPCFEVFKDIEGEFRFRLIAPNGKIIAASKGYEKRIDCLNGVESVKRNSLTAAIWDLVEGKKIESLPQTTEAQVKAREETTPSEEISEPAEEPVEEIESAGETPEPDSEKSNRPIIAVIAGIIGAIIGYFIAVSVSNQVAVILAVSVGFIMGFGIGLIVLKTSSTRTLMTAITGVVGGIVGYVIAITVSDPIGILLSVITGAILGFGIVWEADM
jgi:uncharacterized protein YegP (UPF0339 family)